MMFTDLKREWNKDWRIERVFARIELIAADINFELLPEGKRQKEKRE